MNIKRRTVYIGKIAILSALSFVVMIFEFPIPVFPLFLKIDLSEVPALISAFALGPISGIIIELIKNVLHITFSATAGIGELANFIVGAAFVGTAGAIYQRKKTKTTAFISMAAGTAAMVITAALANYYILIPLYRAFLKFPDPRNTLITDVRTLVMYGIIPFNIIKGVTVSFTVAALYKKVSPVLH